MIAEEYRNDCLPDKALTGRPSFRDMYAGKPTAGTELKILRFVGQTGRRSIRKDNGHAKNTSDLQHRFRQEAVNLLLTSGRPVKRVVAIMGFSANSLRTGRYRALGNGGGAQATWAEPKGRNATPVADAVGEPTEGRSPAPGSPQGGAQRQQIRRLQRENE
jgi:transposase-like protein